MESEERMERREEARVERRKRSWMKNNTPWYVWLGVAVLIVLLLVWLSIAMFTGDTDVNMIHLF